MLADDRLRVAGRHLLDLHASRRRRHDERQRRLAPAPGAPGIVDLAVAVEGDGEVELAVDVDGFFHQDAPDLLALGTGLVGDELHAEDLRGVLLGLVGGLGQLHAAALAAAAGVDLGLDHGASAVLFAELAGLGRVGRHLASGRRHAVAAQDLLGLVFVDLQDCLLWGDGQASRPIAVSAGLRGR